MSAPRPSNRLLSWQTGAVVAIGAALVSGVPGRLSSSREESPANPTVSTHGQQRIPARLWQDPFQALEASSATLKLADLVAPAMASQPAGNAGTNRTLALAVMVNGTPYSEGVEARLRARYAVLSALGAAGYVPADSEHIGVLNTDFDAGGLKPLTLPFEWFKSHKLVTAPNGRRSHASVLVLWLREDDVAHAALDGLASMAGQLQKAPFAGKFLDVRILGPRNSTTLRSMVDSLNGNQNTNTWSNLRDVRIYSATATAPDKELFEGLAPTPGTSSVQGLFRKHQIRFERSIATDDKLAGLLAKELGERGVRISDSAGGLTRVVSGAPHVVLLSEWDSFYGRSLPEEIRAKLLGGLDGARSAGSRIHSFNYLKGVDGKISGAMQGGSGSAADAEAVRRGGELERADGRAQLDYVRRLARSIESTTAGERIGAIGVLGSDVYDKLLLLQDLRRRFPGALFFTTDLDARLWHPREHEWTRNLIIASSFDLQLLPKFQRGIPPFRDGYQTALFLACQRAMDTPGAEEQASRQIGTPKLFELATSGPYRVHPTTHDEHHGHLKSLFTGLVFNGCVVALAAAVFSFSSGSARKVFKRAAQMPVRALKPALAKLTPSPASAGDRNDSTTEPGELHALEPGEMPHRAEIREAWIEIEARRTARLLTLFFGFVAASIVFCIILFVEVHREWGEPVVIFEGISIWPTAFLRLVGLFLAVFFLIKAVHDLQQGALLLGKYFTDADRVATPPLAEDTAASASRFSRWFGQHFRQQVSIAWWTSTSHDPELGTVDMGGLFREYQQRATTASRRVRVCHWTLGFVVSLVLVLAWLGFPHRPYRGDVANVVDAILTVAFTVATAILLVFVWDASRLCHAFVTRLGAARSDKYAEGFSQEAARHRGMLVDDLVGWLDVRVVARHTQAIGWMIYYPFVLLLLLIIQRQGWFDNWDWPPGLITVSAAVAVTSALLIRQAAEKVRRSALKHLTHLHARYTALADTKIAVEVAYQAASGKGLTWLQLGASDYAKRINALMEDIRAEHRGAFAPLIRDPAIGAMLLPSGGAGILALLDRLLSGGP